MKRLLLAGSLLTIGAGMAPAAEWALPWFHTRPKPVILNAEPKPAVTQTARVAYHGKTAYPATGRLYFPDSRDQLTGEKRPAANKVKIFKAVRTQ